MYVVTVEFVVKSDQVDAFREHMLLQASNSLNLEPGCHHFDVCFDPEDSRRCFLYEQYTDNAAFDAHLATNHFANFDAAVQPLLESKSAQHWTLAAAK